MPKKTKQEKIIAQLRRKLDTVKTVTEVAKTSALPEIPLEKKESVPITTTNYQLPSAYPFVLKDLRKTFILAILAISLEFGIYWFTELGGSRFFKF